MSLTMLNQADVNKVGVDRFRSQYSSFYTGTIKAIKTDKDDDILKYGFIRPHEVLPKTYSKEKDVYFRVYNVHSGAMEIEENDRVEFTLGIKNTDNPVAFKVRVIQFRQRSIEFVETYLRNCVFKLRYGERILQSEYMIDLMTCDAVWKCVGNTNLSNKGIELLMLLMNYLEQESKSLYENYKKLIEEVINTTLFNPQKGRFKDYINHCVKDGNFETLGGVQSFLQSVLKFLPQKSRSVVSLVKPMVETNAMEGLLYSMFQQASKATGVCIEDMAWDEMPLVPSSMELLHGVMESSVTLQPVITKGQYNSVQEYIDTYFKLLRADCFDAVTKGIKALLSGKLDPRDMHVYQDVRLAGIIINQSGNVMSLGLKVIPQKKIKNWEYSSNLMFGNLVCISVTGNFKDVLWAIVVDRSLLQTKQIVLVDLCTECNEVNDSEAVRSLEVASGQGCLMVESPTYYRAYQPVLKTLQKLEPEQLPFQDELIHTKKSVYPSFISSASTLDGSIIYNDLSTNTDMTSFLSHASHEKSNTTLDRSQEAAIKHALTNRVAIVQGPPGTGKTYIGVKLIQLLISLEPKPKLPILVVTYKNHALDEFLKGILPIIPNKVVRIGGRSQDPELKSCNLSELQRKHRMPEVMFKDILQHRRHMDELKPKIESVAKELSQHKILTLQTMQNLLSSNQLQQLLNGCDWDKLNIPTILHQTDEEGFTLVGKKNMDAEEANEILENLEMNAKEFLITNQSQRGEIWKHVNLMIRAALKQWIPNKAIFDNTLKSTFGRFKGSNSKSFSTTNDLPLPTDTDIDKEEVIEMEKERTAALSSNIRSKEDILKQMILLEEHINTSVDNDEYLATLTPSSKKLIQDLPMGYLMNLENLWELSPKERVIFIQAVLCQHYEEQGVVFEELLSAYQNICAQKTEIENRHKISILNKMTVVGMTITGASIHQELLSQLQPSIVLVEEAAEVLEPQLLSTIGNWCKQLILIGDHKQLRPPVESYTLVKDFHFDLSMMERLINNNTDHSTLETQNRMRPEFAELLLDIYPHLTSNLDRVRGNHPPSCMASSMYFWDHTSLETCARSYTNENEVDRAIKLALFLIQQEYEPSRITILGAYQGQVRLLRQRMRVAEVMHKSIFDLHVSKSSYNRTYSDEDSQNVDKDDEEERKNRVKIQTIDNFQGDENDVIIVSLVRSNASLKVGFLNTLNRRCVAQSRAKCGMYFIGNRTTMTGSHFWVKLIDGMSAKACIGETITLQCPKHRHNQIFATSADHITLGNFCKQNCLKEMSCGLHYCKRVCQPTHDHLRCKEEVDFVFIDCKHPGKRPCFESEKKQQCSIPVPFTFPSCHHSTKKPCWVKAADVKCLEKCTKLLLCKHKCGRKCSETCDTNDTCIECERLKKVKEEMERKAEEKRIEMKRVEIKKEIEEMKCEDESVLYTELKSNGDQASEYYDVEDRVNKYIQAGQNWYPKVTKIIKVTNNNLHKKWLEARLRLFNPDYSALKFYGTNAKEIEAIAEKGFLMPKPKEGGILFTTDSSKGSDSLLLCDVLLGKSLTENGAFSDMTHRKLRIKSYDSLFARRDTGESGVKYDEFVVFHKDYALVKYIIHYAKIKVYQVGKHSMLEQVAFSQNKTIIHNILPKREVSVDDELDSHFRVAQSQFLRLQGEAEIKSVDYIINPQVLIKFEDKAAQFNHKYRDSEESGVVLAFHGSIADAIRSIAQTNFDLSRIQRGLYGKGIYFSEFPNTSLGYGDKGSLLLCKILPGRSYDMTMQEPNVPLHKGFDSHRVKADSDGRGKMLVIYNIDQILPCYIINFG